MKITDYPIVHNPVTYENALAGNRTPVSRVAGENSTTEPPMLDSNENLILDILIALLHDFAVVNLL